MVAESSEQAMERSEHSLIPARDGTGAINRRDPSG
jgi:hypothetical protein